MNVLTLTAFSSTTFALIALVVAVFALQRSDKRWRNSRIALDVAAVEADIERLTTWYKKLNASYALIIARGKRHSDRDDDPPVTSVERGPNESAEKWKARVRAGIATGSIKRPN